MKRLKIIILYSLMLFSLLIDLSPIPKNFSNYYFYIIKPLYWSFILILNLIFFKNSVIINKKYKKDIVFIICISILIYFLTYFWIGIINGFGYNPYDNSLKGVLFNLWTILPLILSREFIRYYVINNCKQKNVLWITLITSIIFVLVESNMYKFNIYFKDSLSTLKYFMEIFTPSFITQLFLTYLCYFTGIGLTILYILIPQIIMFIMPILPKVDTSILAILNSIFPFLTYLLINYNINKVDKTLERKTITKPINVYSIIIMFLFALLMLCFGLGVFPYSPLVIASNSMAPQIYKGDIVIIKNDKYDKVKIGDIVRYKIDDYYVVHRVENIYRENGKTKLVMKGDNNKDIDLYPVVEEQFCGIIKFKIAYLGWPTIFLNELFNPNVEEKVIVDKGVK